MLGFCGQNLSDLPDLNFEPAFLLSYFGGFLLSEIDDMPISKRNWFLQRLQKELTKKDDAGNQRPIAQSRALHQNDPQTRALQGMTRAEGPSRTRRFT